MASWNDKQYNSQLASCPICRALVAHKKLQKHTLNCWEQKKDAMYAIGVIQCPFVEYHVLPAMYLNHHLDGNCQGVLNHLREFYQKDGLFKEFTEAPPNFDLGVLEEYVSPHNKNLLYMLRSKLHGGTYVEREEKANEAERAAAEAAASRPPEDID